MNTYTPRPRRSAKDARLSAVFSYLTRNTIRRGLMYVFIFFSFLFFFRYTSIRSLAEAAVENRFSRVLQMLFSATLFDDLINVGQQRLPLFVFEPVIHFTDIRGTCESPNRYSLDVHSSISFSVRIQLDFYIFSFSFSFW